MIPNRPPPLRSKLDSTSLVADCIQDPHAPQIQVVAHAYGSAINNTGWMKTIQKKVFNTTPSSSFERCRGEHERYVAQCGGVEVLSALDLEAIPPFDYAHEHFGYRDRLSQPVIEGTGVEPTPGSGPSIKPGEFFLGYPDEEGPAAGLPQPEILSRNGSYVAYLRMEEHVGAFRDFLREQRGFLMIFARCDGSGSRSEEELARHNPQPHNTRDLPCLPICSAMRLS